MSSIHVEFNIFGSPLIVLIKGLLTYLRILLSMFSSLSSSFSNSLDVLMQKECKFAISMLSYPIQIPI